jgi:hypothetical protein
MPAIASIEALERAVAEFEVTGLDVTVEHAALGAAQRSLEDSGLLLLGEVHGVRENPLIALALMNELNMTGLALEWPSELAPLVSAFLADGRLPDNPMLWGGDGRITAGHLAVMRELVRTGRLENLTLFDGWSDVGWSLREASMSERILMADLPDRGTLVVAGNMHTPMTETTLGLPLGARLAAKRPGVREVQIRYGSGGFYNARPRKFKSHFSFRRHVRLHTEHGQLVFELPVAAEADVPHQVGPANGGRHAR